MLSGASVRVRVLNNKPYLQVFPLHLSPSVAWSLGRLVGRSVDGALIIV
jgi:hypothetical protein